MRRYSSYLISLATLAIVALALVAAELTVRRVAPEQCDRARAIRASVDRQLAFLKPCARVVVEDGSEMLHIVSSFRRESFVPVRKAPGTVRIAVVGESSGELLGDSLLGMINHVSCASRYEVLNCARSAADLATTERMFDEVMTYEPDAVVVVFGHNLQYEYPEPFQLRARLLVGSSCLLSSLLRVPREENIFRVSRIGPKLAELDLFLRRVAETSQERSILPIFSTMAVNLWMPPQGNELSHDALASEAALLREEEKVDEAVATLSDSGVGEAERHFRAGVWLAQSGRAAEAYAELQAAVDEDAAIHRRRSAVNTLIRRVAGESGALLRDTERAVEARAPLGLPGWESFNDNCHLNEPGILAETREVFTTVRDHLRPRDVECDPSRWRGWPESPPLKRLLDGVFTFWGGDAFVGAVTYAVTTLYRMDPDQTLAAVERAVRHIESETRPYSQILVAMAEGLRRIGRTDDARRINELARQRDPKNTRALTQASILAWRGGDNDQARAFAKEAARLDPTDQLAPAILRRTRERQAGKELIEQ